MLRLTLVRHAAAGGSGPDSRLTPVGLEQAERLCDRLRSEPFTAAWCSPQPRARETAERIVASHPGLTVRTHPGLREVDAFSPDAGEADLLRQVAAGTEDWWSAAREDEGHLLVVAHGGPIRLLCCLLLGLPPERHWSFRVDHASVSVVDVAPDLATIVALNDCCHLEGLRAG